MDGSLFLHVFKVRCVLETMLVLKNSDVQRIPGCEPEPVEKLRKLLRAEKTGDGA